ncbi:MAG: acyl carrier protein [Clostridia bacterium]|nr:acyl carrier protein [Clostridia bacterium]
MLERVIRIIAEYADVPAEEINENTDIRADLGLNSLELVNMAVAIEDEFETEIPDREALGLETVGDIVAVLQRYVTA